MSDLRPEVSWFATEMEKVLKANDGKGGWEMCNDDYFIKRMREELLELRIETFKKPVEPELIIHEAVDIANFAMMIAHKYHRRKGTEHGEKANHRSTGEDVDG